MYSYFIAYENDEWCRFVVHIAAELLELVAAEYLRETIHQFLNLLYCFLFFRCPEKGFEEERNKKKDGNS